MPQRIPNSQNVPLPSRRQLLGGCASTLLLATNPSLLRSDDTVDLLAGNDLSQWVEEFHARHQAKAAAEKWNTFSLKDGVLRCDGSFGNVGFLRYKREFCDFELHAEVRAPAGCNNGICFRAPTYTKPTPAHTGYELQLMWMESKDPLQQTGALYSVLGPAKQVKLRPDAWHKVRILAQGAHIQAWIDGTQVQDYHQDRNEATKDRPLCGYVFVQNHGGDTEFRNFTVRTL